MEVDRNTPSTSSKDVPAPDAPVQEAPSARTDPVWSEGSAAHGSGTCKPCAWYFQGGCAEGAKCVFCHLCDASALREYQQNRLECLKANRVYKGKVRRSKELGYEEGDVTSPRQLCDPTDLDNVGYSDVLQMPETADTGGSAGSRDKQISSGDSTAADVKQMPDTGGSAGSRDAEAPSRHTTGEEQISGHAVTNASVGCSEEQKRPPDVAEAASTPLSLHGETTGAASTPQASGATELEDKMTKWRNRKTQRKTGKKDKAAITKHSIIPRGFSSGNYCPSESGSCYSNSSYRSQSGASSAGLSSRSIIGQLEPAPDVSNRSPKRAETSPAHVSTDVEPVQQRSWGVAPAEPEQTERRLWGAPEAEPEQSHQRRSWVK